MYILYITKGENMKFIICPHCKKVVEFDDRFCEHCGYPLSTIPKGQKTIVKQPKNNTFIKAIIPVFRI